nr:hypothetical protein [Deltaproteobacteria bacterium]
SPETYARKSEDQVRPDHVRVVLGDAEQPSSAPSRPYPQWNLLDVVAAQNGR